MHWTNAVAMLLMIGSGWGIYNDSVIFSALHFSRPFRIGNWAAESLQWHFAGMWLLVLNGAAYLLYGVFTGRLRERLLPIRFRDLVQTVRDTLRLHVAHEDLTTYNAVQKLLYIVVMLAGVSQVVSGLAIWKPVQFSGLTALLGRVPGGAARAPSPAWRSSSASWSCTSPCRCLCRRRCGPCSPAAPACRPGARGHEVAVPPRGSARPGDSRQPQAADPAACSAAGCCAAACRSARSRC